MKSIAPGNRKSSPRCKALGHILALLGMLFLARFILVPCLENFEKIPGESSVQTINLPGESKNVHFCIDSLTTDAQFALEINGWAFIKGKNTDNQGIFIVLHSEENDYVFNTMLRRRPALTKHFQAKYDQNLELAGFQAIIPIRLINNGEYRVGILVTKDDIKALSYSEEIVFKSRGQLCNALESTVDEIDLPRETGDIVSDIEKIKDVGQTYKVISGWAFIEGVESEGSEIYLVLQSERRTYALKTNPKKREDVTAAHRDLNLNLDNSGFEAWINVWSRKGERIRSDDYRLGIYIKNGDLEAFSPTDTILRKTRRGMEVLKAGTQPE